MCLASWAWAVLGATSLWLCWGSITASGTNVSLLVRTMRLPHSGGLCSIDVIYLSWLASGSP